MNVSIQAQLLLMAFFLLSHMFLENNELLFAQINSLDYTFNYSKKAHGGLL